MDNELDLRLKQELAAFENVWEGGYYEGDPLKPLGGCSYRQLGFMSVLHATYLRCIKPYINDQTVALEIGPGAGAWTRALLPAKEVYALDAQPESHSGLMRRLGHPANVKYFQVTDFKCAMIPANRVDFMFSFGCLCHVSFAGIEEYAVNLYPKLKHGCNCFWMVADYDKYNAAVANLSIWNTLRHAIPGGRRNSPLRWLFGLVRKKHERLHFVNKDEIDETGVARWYHAGIDRTCNMLTSVGYQVVDSDVGTCLRDPIVHFRKT
jgi:hypothetical protein